MSLLRRLFGRSPAPAHFTLGRELSNALIELFRTSADVNFLAVTSEESCLAVFLDRSPTIDAWRLIPHEVEGVPVVVRWPTSEAVARPDAARWPVPRATRTSAQAMSEQIIPQLARFLRLPGVLKWAVRQAERIVEVHVVPASDAHYYILDRNVPETLLTVLDGHALRLAVRPVVRWRRAAVAPSA